MLPDQMHSYRGPSPDGLRMATNQISRKRRLESASPPSIAETEATNGPEEDRNSLSSRKRITSLPDLSRALREEKALAHYPGDDSFSRTMRSLMMEDTGEAVFTLPSTEHAFHTTMASPWYCFSTTVDKRCSGSMDLKSISTTT